MTDYIERRGSDAGDIHRSDPKPLRRYRATPEEWKLIRKRILSRPCCICGGKAESVHHIYKRSQGGDDVFPNLVPLCGSGTTGCHGHVEARDPEYLAALPIDGAFGAYLATKLGGETQARAWIDRYLFQTYWDLTDLLGPDTVSP